MTTVPCTDTVTKDNTSVQGTDSAQTAHMRERTPY
ncbi:hypothetical protein PC116_g28696 [Phytophthora cactorum]|uniref:Uncharacterized protein n=1 Tax=Phytophthora cactorum TaxID=29920 RepID=A0A8T1AIU3_9STRA|nr:hypothetical protein Pcac1_g12651 [Phytophthora cactorum]KAG2872363.1 hypothetical protein PC114_g26418 [Phytophthora cactorum]KAG2882148.1 hypothetical protein PC117_g26271 [Phytophthora cactorum]KAG2961672.1 hypothetical protein PC119_g26043 [Phytophthora cactorum]KAG3124168.1 hypothetical protein C6341_g26272 [Phytophthora cactorum]